MVIITAFWPLHSPVFFRCLPLQATFKEFQIDLVPCQGIFCLFLFYFCSVIASHVSNESLLLSPGIELTIINVFLSKICLANKMSKIKKKIRLVMIVQFFSLFKFDILFWKMSIIIAINVYISVTIPNLSRYIHLNI